MTNDLVQYNDGFDGHTDETEGTEQRRSGLLRGLKIKFTNESSWIDANGEVLGENTMLVVSGIARAVQRWGADQKPLETITLGPGEKFPDLDSPTGWNSKVPKNEWTKGPDGKPRGPWQAQQFLYFMDPETMAEYTWPTFTTGGNIAIRELTDKVKWMRRFRGASACPVVGLSDVFMNTRFGGRQRPHFIVHRWIDLSGGSDPAQIEGPTSGNSGAAAIVEAKVAEVVDARTDPAMEPPGQKTAAKPRGPRSKSFAIGDRAVSTPSMSEELNDKIPW